MQRILHLRTISMLVAIGIGTSCTSASSQTSGREATPMTLQLVLATARGGQKIVLAPGDYGALTIARKTYAPHLAIDASKARFTNLIIRNSSGIDVTGGAVLSYREVTQAVVVDSSHDISLSDMRVSGARVAMTVNRSQHVALLRNNFEGTRSDGVNVAMSQHVRVEGNICRKFNPILAVYDEKGKLLRDADHPDCVQAWSRPNAPPTSDVLIADNIAEGFMQGIFFGDPGNGGYDRIVIRGNTLTLSAWNGIVLFEARDSAITNNVVRTVPGARALNYPFQPIISWIKVSGERNRTCGNTVEVPRWSVGTERC